MMLRRIVVAGACLLVLSASPAAFASDQSDVLHRMQQTIDEANRSIDPPKLAVNFTQSVVLVDDLAPFVFTGAAEDALSTWTKAYEDDAEQTGVTNFSMQLLKPRQIEVNDTHAYIVLPAVYHFKQHNKASRERGVITATLEKVNGTWLISTWSWAGE
ncbi:hypothetical protein [Paraburkholderia solisilvae]|uniref:SnoaL-like domain-containing protein n=1 Tax=Paraburkholderia solisilvae TaxID=624376 RepID=A0A6J5E5F8_9BURK|nr:hypothetical protein [Paraburkholderia solisilvae]CAB3761603.1 hypothetical protein LMG29739_03663 [Paraburkholderia solisilvae]